MDSICGGKELDLCEPIQYYKTSEFFPAAS